MILNNADASEFKINILTAIWWPCASLICDMANNNKYSSNFKSHFIRHWWGSVVRVEDSEAVCCGFKTHDQWNFLLPFKLGHSTCAFNVLSQVLKNCF